MTGWRAGGAVLIPARTGSTRLPEKLLEPIGEFATALEFLVSRLRLAVPGCRVILCTTERPEDERLVAVAVRCGVEHVRGDELDIIARFELAAATFGLEWIINVDGDDLFCSPALVAATADVLGSEQVDVVGWEGLPLGIAPLGFTRDALARVISAKTSADTSTGWRNYFLEYKEFRVQIHGLNDQTLRRPEIRLTLDYPQDLQVFRILESHLHHLSPTFEIAQIIEAFDTSEGLAALNAEVSGEYWRRYQASAADKTL